QQDLFAVSGFRVLSRSLDLGNCMTALLLSGIEAMSVVEGATVEDLSLGSARMMGAQFARPTSSISRSGVPMPLRREFQRRGVTAVPFTAAGPSSRITSPGGR